MKLPHRKDVLLLDIDLGTVVSGVGGPDETTK
jgi:hypothetical protein